MTFFLVSLIFTGLFVVLKIGVSRTVSPDFYGWLAVMWNCGNLIGSQLFGCIPRLFPSRKFSRGEALNIDFVSLILCFAIFLFTIRKTDYPLISSVALLMMIANSAFYEFAGTLATIRKSWQSLLIVEAINVSSIMCLFVSLLFWKAALSSKTELIVAIIYFPMFLILCFYFRKYKFNIDLNFFSEATTSKITLILSQSNVYLFPVFLLALDSPYLAGIFSLVNYVISLPANFNQLVINRVAYSSGGRAVKKLFFIISALVILEAIGIFVIYEINPKIMFGSMLENPPLALLCAYLLVRSLHTTAFAFARIHGVTGHMQFVAEAVRLLIIVIGCVMSVKLDNISASVLLIQTITVGYFIVFIANTVLFWKKNNV